MRTALLALGVIIAALLGYFFFFASPTYTNYPPRQGPVVMFGDSLVAGTGASDGRSLPARIAEGIGEPVENFGVSGNTTAQALERIDVAVARHPRIAIVLLGGNDYLRRIPPEQTFKNLGEIIDRFQKDGAVVVLLGVRGGVLVDNFSGEFKSLAHEKGAVYVSDVLHGLLGNKELMSDQVHPNDAGYAVIAERVVRALKPVLH